MRAAGRNSISAGMEGGAGQARRTTGLCPRVGAPGGLRRRIRSAGVLGRLADAGRWPLLTLARAASRFDQIAI